MISYYVKHYVCLLIGLNLMAISIALGKLSNLGTSPISSIPNVLSLITPLTIGQVTIIFMLSLIVLEAIILKSKFNWKNLF